MTIIFLPYILYIIWCIFLISILPNPDGNFESLIDVGVMTSSIVAGVILLFGGFILLRIQKSDASQYSKVISLGKLFGVLLPGLALSAFVAIQIPKEPSLSLIVIHPESTKNLRAPLSVTFSAEKAGEILATRNLSIVKVKWDFENDGNINDETIEPKVTARFDKKGAYVIQAVLELNDNSKRFLYKQLLIP
ncbi:MAG: hypothetical protein KAS32_24565, partial [Candidatus Peribacteraceae bacterium]|nr:hypothetical protein [Candidatus Peribacteraceae bacterium]